MTAETTDLQVRLASGAADLWAAQRLRYRVFVAELGAMGGDIDHATGIERDGFDTHCDHLLLVDPVAEAAGSADYAVGVYRLMDNAQAARAGGFYSRSEFDLSLLIASGRPLLELGRSCVAKGHRGGTAMYLLWQGLAKFIEARGIELLFGVASFHGTDVQALAEPLSLLHHRHLAPAHLRPQAIGPSARAIDLLPMGDINRVAAMKATPALIKAYLRLGGYIGQGAFVDADFNTTDLCLVLEADRVSPAQRAIYAPGRSA